MWYEFKSILFQNIRKNISELTCVDPMIPMMDTFCLGGIVEKRIDRARMAVESENCNKLCRNNANFKFWELLVKIDTNYSLK